VLALFSETYSLIVVELPQQDHKGW